MEDNPGVVLISLMYIRTSTRTRSGQETDVLI